MDELVARIRTDVMTDAEVQIRSKVKMVAADENFFGALSGERIAVALMLDRYDLLQRAWGTIARSGKSPTPGMDRALAGEHGPVCPVGALRGAPPMRPGTQPRGPQSLAETVRFVIMLFCIYKGYFDILIDLA
jgi:hypothetical protein